LIRRDGLLVPVESDGGLLGIFPDETYAEGQIQLQSGDRLFVYSDGIEVAFTGDQLGNSQQWHKELQSRASLSTDKILTEISDALDRETGSLQPKDDVSMVVVEVD
jgi:serine phosphatase RsbU (regulator of sigma subunit)